MILHIDMDAFFASVEQATIPYLKGKPTIVHGRGERHGVVLTASYEARRFAIKSGMALKTAKRLCPAGFFIGSHPEKYIYFASKIQELLMMHSSRVEITSIDEAFIDLGSVNCAAAINSANIIKNEIYRKYDLTCSIGISTSRMFAKISTGFGKPDGITCIMENSISQEIYKLPVENIPGVGEKTRQFLNLVGIEKIGDIAKKENRKILFRLGKFGENLIRAVEGKKESILFVPSIGHIEKSLSNEETFEFDTLDMELIKNYVIRIIDRLSRRMRKRNFIARTLSVKVRYFDFTTVVRQKSFSAPIFREDILFSESLVLISKLMKKTVRLIGIKVTNLIEDKRTFQPPCLFGEDIQEKFMNLYRAIDIIKDRFGEDMICPARCLLPHTFVNDNM